MKWHTQFQACRKDKLNKQNNIYCITATLRQCFGLITVLSLDKKKDPVPFDTSTNHPVPSPYFT